VHQIEAEVRFARVRRMEAEPGSPAALKQEIWRNHPEGSKVDLVERLLERRLSDDPARPITRKRQPASTAIWAAARRVSR